MDSYEKFGNLPITGIYGLDYLIGEECYLGKGLDKHKITLLVEKINSIHDAVSVIADIHKTLLSCGFELFEPEQSRYVTQKKQIGNKAIVNIMLQNGR